MFRVVFWGVRGSIPVPGPQTAEVGGNTSCVEVLCGKTRLVFDGGTGLRLLGQSLLSQLPVTAHLFFSHVHWDHIQGFPFFAPAFITGNAIHMYGGRNVFGSVETALAGQMQNPNFPVLLRDLPAKLEFHDILPNQTFTIDDTVRITTAPGRHPGGVLAYRIEYDGKVLVYATDTEHAPQPDAELVELLRDADVVVYDSQYTNEEYTGGGKHGPSKVGWGHSTYEAAIATIKAAGAKKYVLFHHDPGQDDAAVRDKEARAQALFPNSVAAREGMVIEL